MSIVQVARTHLGCISRSAKSNVKNSVVPIMKPGPTIRMEIAGILEISAKGIQVINKKTGKAVWLPKDELQYLPGCVMLPEWLAKKFTVSGAPGARKAGKIIVE